MVKARGDLNLLLDGADVGPFAAPAVQVSGKGEGSFQLALLGPLGHLAKTSEGKAGPPRLYLALLVLCPHRQPVEAKIYHDPDSISSQAEALVSWGRGALCGGQRPPSPL